MKEIIKISSLSLFMAMTFLFFSCGNEEDNDDELSINNSSTSGNDDSIYDVVGTWKATYYWSYSSITETIIMEINRDCTLSYISTNDRNTQDPIVGNGTWKYDNSSHKWEFSTGYSMISGNYTIVGNQLISQTYFDDGSSRTIIFNRQ